MSPANLTVVLFSDIHGNAAALRAVLAEVGKMSYDRIVCLGDIASLGPQPTETIDLLRPLACACVMGNHEEAMLHPERWGELGIFPAVQPDVQWGMKQLRELDRQFLATCRPTVEMTVGDNTQVLCCHGSPSCSTDIMHPDMPAGVLERYFAGCPASIVVGGHIHMQYHQGVNGRVLINPGSVGMPFKVPPGPGQPPVIHPWAEYAVLRVNPVSAPDAAGVNVDVELRRVRYDVTDLEKALHERDLPGKAWWLAQLAQPEFARSSAT